MHLSPLKILALSFAFTGGDVATELELRETVLELQQLLQVQQDQIHQLQDSEARRLQGQTIEDVSDTLGNLTHNFNTLEASLTSLSGAADSMWLIICGAMVMFMQAGFAMLEAGSCRAKNVQSILTKNLADVCVGTIAWFLIGWMIAYGGNNDDAEVTFAGTRQFASIGFNKDTTSGAIESSSGPLNWFFQWAFCSAAATIVSGGVAERVKMPGYLVYSTLMTGVVYPVVVAWTWGYGWLSSDVNDVNFMDFAGSGIVHMTGGVGALVGAIFAGPRKGRWENPRAFDPHSAPLVVLGTFILWFGWYGFNCGSTLSMSSASTGKLAAQVAMNTTLSAAFGGITVFLCRLAMTKGLYDNAGLCNGILAGLVSITAGCGNVEAGSACLIGILGGLLYTGTSELIKKVKIDDPLDAFAIHGACGAWGTMAAAFFDWGKGFDHVHAWSGWDCMRDEVTGACLEGVGGQLIAANLVEVISICAWVSILSCLIFFPLRMFGLLKASDDDQDLGMDAKHSPQPAYDLGTPKKSKVLGQFGKTTEAAAVMPTSSV